MADDSVNLSRLLVLERQYQHELKDKLSVLTFRLQKGFAPLVGFSVGDSGFCSDLIFDCLFWSLDLPTLRFLSVRNAELELIVVR